MPRYPRSNIKSYIHHIMVQGIDREYIFQKEKYKKYYMKQINEKSEEIQLIACCIMDNHAHLLVYSEDINKISKYMQKINTSFAKIYNSQENRVGYVFRDRYKSENITNIRYLKVCIAYIHNNPVKAGIVKQPNQYKYSTYNKYIIPNSIDKKIIDIVFDNSENYIEEFVKMHNVSNNIKFLEMQEKTDVKELIDKYLKDNKTTIENMKKHKDKISDFVIEMINNKGISINKISTILGISRTKIKSILDRNCL